MTDFEKMLVILRYEEGQSLIACPDPAGQIRTWAIGSGHQITDKTICAALDQESKEQFLPGSLTCNEQLAEAMLRIQAQEALNNAKGRFRDLRGVRLIAIAVAIYQLGHTFLWWTDTCFAIEREGWPAAADAMRDSKWHNKQTPERAERVCKMIESGEWPEWIKELQAKEAKP